MVIKSHLEVGSKSEWYFPGDIPAFAGFQGVLRYLNDYISAWTSQRITNDVKFDLFHKLIYMDPQFYDENPSGIIILYVLLLKIIGYKGVIFNLKMWKCISNLNNNLTGQETTGEENNTVGFFLEI